MRSTSKIAAKALRNFIKAMNVANSQVERRGDGGLPIAAAMVGEIHAKYHTAVAAAKAAALGSR